MAKILICDAQNGDVLTSFPSSELQTFLNSVKKDFKFEVQIQEDNFEPIAIGDYVKLADDSTPTCPPGQHWDTVQQKCVPDVISTGLLYDSNTDIDWANWNGKTIKIGSPYGDVTKPNSKYIRMNASGDPRITFDSPNKTLLLQHDGDWGRAYFGVINYEAKLEVEWKIDSFTSDRNCSLCTRSRHQYNEYLRDIGQPETTETHLQGGVINSWHESTVEDHIEVIHHVKNTQAGSANLPKKLIANTWYKSRFSQWDDNGKIHYLDEFDYNDGQGYRKIKENTVSTDSQLFNKAEFMQWSEFRIRLNAVGGSKIWLKNIKLYSIP